MVPSFSCRSCRYEHFFCLCLLRHSSQLCWMYARWGGIASHGAWMCWGVTGHCFSTAVLPIYSPAHKRDNSSGSISQLTLVLRCLFQGKGQVFFLNSVLRLYYYYGPTAWHVGSSFLTRDRTWPVIEPALPALEAWSLNPWTIRAGKSYYRYSYLEQRKIYCRAVQRRTGSLW